MEVNHSEIGKVIADLRERRKQVTDAGVAELQKALPDCLINR